MPQIAFRADFRASENWIGVTLDVQDGIVVGAVAASMYASDNPQSSPSETTPVKGGWIQLYKGSLADPSTLSGKMDLEMPDGGHFRGDFSVMDNPPINRVAQ